MRRVDSPALLRTIEELAAPEALVWIERDPYWPKWDSPWWKLTLLMEAGRLDRAPRAAIEALARVSERHYLHHFPLRAEEVPPGTDTERQVVCHCALGTLYKLAAGAGVPVDQDHPWMREWFLRYQMEDGGLNCDEAAYLKSPPRGSFLSTLPPLEAVLHHTGRDFTPAELEFLRRGAAYLVERRLFRSKRDPARVADARWLVPSFPRFYGYDVLRGLAFLAAWAERTRSRLPREAVAEAVEAVRGAMGPDGQVVNKENSIVREARTIEPDGAGGWRRVPRARSFALLDEWGAAGRPSEFLTREWKTVEAQLARLERDGLLA